MIATQGLLPNTIVHFLQMIVEQKADSIVMLCKATEKNKYGKYLANSQIAFTIKYPLRAGTF